MSATSLFRFIRSSDSVARVSDGRAPAPFTWLGAIAAAAIAHVAIAAPIAIPNGDFSDPGNFGSIGGGLIGASGTDVPIGAGPWLGSYAGVLGLLAPPTLTISDGSAEISGLAAANLFGIFDNGGAFSQTLSQDYEPDKAYTVSAVVDTGTALDIGLLTSGNFGIALMSGDTTIATTVTAPLSLLDLEPLGGTAYQLTLTYDSDANASGPIGVALFAEPQQLIGATLLPQVTFGAVTLDGTAINPNAGSIVAVDATPQSAMVGQPFANALEVEVTDADGDPVPGVTVTFADPASGASADLSATTVNTDNGGFASITATANTVAGSYTVSASVDGVAVPAIFSLTNTAGPVAATLAAEGDGQSAPINTAFPLPLVVLATDAFGNPVEGVEADFSAPSSGASAALSAMVVFTDANGLAQVEATANGIVGSYEITAGVAGLSPPTTFALTNRVDSGTTIGSTSGNGQSASVGGAFACALSATVAAGDGSPLAGYAVDFTAPSSGASAVLYNGVVSGTTVRALTDANGVATVDATANDIPGDYDVTAQLVDSSADPVVFALSNVEGLIFQSGFDTACSALLP